MRKLLAVVLTVLMLTSVLAVFPASAAETNNSTPLLITEIAHNYSNKVGTNTAASGDNTEHWEIYNNSDAPVNIYDLSLAQSPMYKNEPALTDKYHDNWNMWQTQKAFFAKCDIKQGDILAGASIDSSVPHEYLFVNDIDNAELAPGEIAVIWFVRTNTLKAINDYIAFMGITEAAEFDVREYFIDLYSTDLYTVPENTKFYFVWIGDSDTDADTGLLLRDTVVGDDCGTNVGHMYGLVADTVELDTCVYDEAGKLSSDVYALAGFGGGVKNFSTQKSARSHNYVPASASPDYYNALEKYRGTENFPEEGYSDYVAAGCVPGYEVAAIVETNLTITPGSLTAMQWAYINPTGAPSEITGGEADWASAYVASYIKTAFPDMSELEDANGETEIEVNPPSQDYLNNLFYPKPTKKPSAAKKGLGTGAIIGIVAGGVVVAAAAAAAVVIVVKKKKSA
jgi:hypothetical protein